MSWHRCKHVIWQTSTFLIIYQDIIIIIIFWTKYSHNLSKYVLYSIYYTSFSVKKYTLLILLYDLSVTNKMYLTSYMATCNMKRSFEGKLLPLRKWLTCNGINQSELRFPSTTVLVYYKGNNWKQENIKLVSHQKNKKNKIGLLFLSYGLISNYKSREMIFWHLIWTTLDNPSHNAILFFLK
jgi:hypothetical protein